MINELLINANNKYGNTWKEEYNEELSTIINNPPLDIGGVIKRLYVKSHGDNNSFKKALSDYSYCEETVINDYLDRKVDINDDYFKRFIIPMRAYRLYEFKNNNRVNKNEY